MDPWLARAERLCYEGEEISEMVRVGAGGVVVTTHRVLAFAPESEGKHLQQADRPNVEGVRRSAAGTVSHLARGGKAAVLGAILLGVGAILNLEGLVADVDLSGGGSAIGLGGVMGLLRTMLDLVASLDDVMVLAGALALLVAAAFFGVYLWTRESTLIVDVADGGELAVPTEEWPEGDVIARLERAIAPTARGAPESGPDTGSGLDGDAPPDGDPLA